jgi:hypothetical protein
MRGRVVAWGVVAVLVVGVSGPGSARAASQSLLPPELSALADEAGCRPIADFLDRPGMVQPSYLYGYAPGAGVLPEAEEEKAAVFWCRSGPGDGSAYRLVFGRKKHPSHGFSLAESRALLPCPAVIEWPSSRGNPPGGLSIATAVSEPLDTFTYADEMETHGPGDEHTTHPPLQSRYDGAGWDFYCHDGRWLVRPRD